MQREIFSAETSGVNELIVLNKISSQLDQIIKFSSNYFPTMIACTIMSVSCRI